MSGGPPIFAATGVTGHLGSAWLRRCLQEDPAARVLALVRNPVRARNAPVLRDLAPDERARVELLPADLAQPAWDQSVVRSLAAVNRGWWHFAAATTLARSPAAAAETAAVNVQGTLNLLDMIRRSGSKAPLYHVSTAYVAGRSGGRIREEPSTAVSFRNPYERSKARAEEAVRRWLSEGHAGAIFRPSVVVGAGGAGAAQLPHLCRRAVALAQARGETRVSLRVPAGAALNLVALEWVVDTLFALTSAARPPTGLFHLTAEADTPVRSLVLAAASLAPNLRVTFADEDAPVRVSAVSRLVDLMLEDVREYFAAALTFDRSRLLRVLPSVGPAEPPDLAAVLGAEPEPVP